MKPNEDERRAVLSRRLVIHQAAQDVLLFFAMRAAE